MANETEVMRDKMEATRNDLSDKLEKLEKSVVDTVQEATTTVAEAVHGAREAVQATQDVVQTVKETVEGAAQSVQGTVDSVKDTMGNVTDSVGGAVEGVKETFADAAASVKETFQNAAETVRDTFDLPKQVDRHPWLMVGGAVAVGFVAGKLLDYAPEAMEAVHTAAHTSGRIAQSAASLAAATASAAGATAAASGGWMAALEKMFGPEVNKVKEMAIGALGSIIRDVAVQAAPEPMARQVRELIDGFTSKLGGKPVDGSVLGPRPSEEEVHNGPGRRF